MTGSSTTEATKGHCLCGDIRFEYYGMPIETLHCHCESCRRHTSSPFSTFVVVNKSTFRYTRGSPVAYASSLGVERTHCGRCGSPIAYENKDEFALYACTLDDPSGVTPTFHSWNCRAAAVGRDCRFLAALYVWLARFDSRELWTPTAHDRHQGQRKGALTVA